MKRWSRSLRHFSVIGFLLSYSVAAYSGDSKYEPEVLNRVIQGVSQVRAEGGEPIVILDLDDTLFDTRPRHKRILREFASQEEISREYPIEADLLRRVRIGQISYHLEDTFRNLGISNGVILEKAKNYWLDRFFTNAYCAKDSAISGAAPYVQLLFEVGAKIAYLTGRDQPGMEEGTRTALLNRGFPLDDSTLLMMKPDKAMDDTVFKQGVFDSLRREGKVVAGFENEPRNINAMKGAFPDAIMVFLDTRHSNKPDVPASGISWIKTFTTDLLVEDPNKAVAEITGGECYGDRETDRELSFMCVVETEEDGIECPPDSNYCEPYYGRPVENICLVTFRKMGNRYSFVANECEDL